MSNAVKIRELAMVVARLEVATEALEAARDLAEHLDHGAEDDLRKIQADARTQLIRVRSELSTLGATRIA